MDQLSYFARVTTRDGRAIEEALAGATLLDDGARLDGAVVEAAYAVDRPPLLKRLGDDGVRRLVDPQTLRFVGCNFLETESLTRLPYAPTAPITANDFSAEEARALSRGVLAYGQDVGVDLHVAPGLPLLDTDLPRWMGHNRRLLAAACACNGGGDIDRRPLLALVAPGPRALADPRSVIEMLIDQPVSGVYVQALNLNPTKDSLEKLARFVQFLNALRAADFPVVVGRVGAFGLILQSLGIHAFDSGLGLAESHNLASLNRRLTESERRRRAERGGGGPSSRVYLQALKTTLPAPAAAAVVGCEDLRHHVVCSLGCCRFRPLADLGDRARAHYLHVRRAEVDDLRKLPVAAMRLHHVETELRQARDLATRVRKAVPGAGLPDFGHLDRWLGLLAREQGTALVA